MKRKVAQNISELFQTHVTTAFSQSPEEKRHSTHCNCDVELVLRDLEMCQIYDGCLRAVDLVTEST